jgi:hypothetical protein
VGAVWTVGQTARHLGIQKALGESFAGQLALWQVLARVLEQGSRLCAVRLAQVHAAGSVLGIRRGFDENDLYANLTWLSQHQPRIEDRLFAAQRGQHKPRLFLYDVTSSYLEGEDNECPYRSMASTNVGIASFSRLPQIRSAASQRIDRAPRTASS